jgi:hypothetical protein
MWPSSQAAMELEEVLELLERGSLNGFPEFLSRVRRIVYRHEMLHHFLLGQPSAQIWMMLFAAACHQRPQALAQMILGSYPRPDTSIVVEIGRGVGYREDQVARLVLAVTGQSHAWKRQVGTAHDIDWGVIQTVAREKPIQQDDSLTEILMPTRCKPRAPRVPMSPVVRTSAPPDTQAPSYETALGAPESDLSLGQMSVQAYYATKRGVLGLTVSALAKRAGIEAFKLARLEHDLSYHLGWSDLKKLGIALGVEPALLRRAHARADEAVGTIEVKEDGHAADSHSR